MQYTAAADGGDWCILLCSLSLPNRRPVRRSSEPSSKHHMAVCRGEARRFEFI